MSSTICILQYHINTWFTVEAFVETVRDIVIIYGNKIVYISFLQKWNDDDGYNRKCQDYVYKMRVLKCYAENKTLFETWK